MGPEFEKGDGRLRPSLQQRLPGAEGPPEGCTTAPRHAACGGPLPSSAEGPHVIRILLFVCVGVLQICQWYRVCDAGALRAEPLATIYILRGHKNWPVSWE